MVIWFSPASAPSVGISRAGAGNVWMGEELHIMIQNQYGVPLQPHLATA